MHQHISHCFHVLFAACVVLQALSCHEPVIFASESQLHPKQRSVIFVLDRSKSMTPHFDLLKIGFCAGLVVLSDEDLASLIVFHHQPEVLVPPGPLAAHRDQLMKRLDAVQPTGGTDIIAAAKAAVSLSLEGGTVILLSDGATTGPDGQTLPVEAWVPEADRLCCDARQKQVTIHTLALGPDAHRDLLTVLSDGSGGRAVSVPRASALAENFIHIAALVGSYWRRSDSGEFKVKLDEPCSLVTADAAPAHLLFRLIDGRPVPLDAGIDWRRAGVRARRYRLPPGEYRFVAPIGQNPILLRPMSIGWRLPQRTEIEAGRENEIAIHARGLNEAVDLDGLTVRLRLASGNQEILGVSDGGASGERAYSFCLAGPAQPGDQLQVEPTAAQDGWRYDLPAIALTAVAPRPFSATLEFPDRDATGLLQRTTLGDEPLRVQGIVRCSAQAVSRNMVLHVQAASGTIKIHPQKVSLLHQVTPVELVVETSGVASKITSAAIRFSVSAEDITAPKVNGSDSCEQIIAWTRLRPGIHLASLSDRRITAMPGQSVSLPVRLETIDLPAPTLSDVAVRLALSQAPPGWKIGWTWQGSASLQPSLPATGCREPALIVRPPVNALPGDYPLQFSLMPSQPGVTLNGSTSPVACRLEAAVPKASAALEILSGGGRWQVTAPIRPHTREMKVRLVALDGRPLSYLIASGTTIACRTEPPVQAELRSRTPEGEWLFAVTVPAQTPPDNYEVKCLVEDQRLLIEQEPSLLIEIPPLAVNAHPKPPRIERFEGWRETALGWMRPRSAAMLTIQADRQAWLDAHASWSLALAAESEIRVDDPRRSLPIDLLRLEQGVVRFHSPYRHTRFAPAPTARTHVQWQIVPVPARFYAFAAAIMLAPAALLALLKRPPWPIGVERDGEAYWRLGQLNVGRFLGAKGLRLTIRRGALGGMRLRLHIHDRSRYRVVLLCSDGSLVLSPGEALALHRDDTIEIESPDGEIRRSRVLSGRYRLPDAETEELFSGKCFHLS